MLLVSRGGNARAKEIPSSKTQGGALGRGMGHMGRGAESRALEPLGHKHRIISATANRRKIAPTCTTFRCSIRVYWPQSNLQKPPRQAVRPAPGGGLTKECTDRPRLRTCSISNKARYAKPPKLRVSAGTRPGGASRNYRSSRRFQSRRSRSPARR